MTMERFELMLKGKLKEVVDENEATDREEVQRKRKFGSGSSNPKHGGNPKRFNPRQFQNKRKQLEGSGGEEAL